MENPDAINLMGLGNSSFQTCVPLQWLKSPQLWADRLFSTVLNPFKELFDLICFPPGCWLHCCCPLGNHNSFYWYLIFAVFIVSSAYTLFCPNRGYTYFTPTATKKQTTGYWKRVSCFLEMTFFSSHLVSSFLLQEQRATWMLPHATSPTCSRHVTAAPSDPCTITSPRPRTPAMYRWCSTWS